MARPPRPQFAGAIYHLTARGNRRLPIYVSDGDRETFFAVLDRVVRRYRWQCHSYCLMDNHYHLLVRTPQPNISIGMCLLNGLYSRLFNARHATPGHLFENRFHSAVVIREEHLLEVARYVVLNPVRAGVCVEPGGWPWSSYRATVGEAIPPRFLRVGWLLDMFASDRQRAREKYRAFVVDGVGGAPPPELTYAPAAMLKELAPPTPTRGRSWVVEGAAPLPLDNLGAAGDGAELLSAFRSGRTVTEIAARLGVHPATVGRRLRRLEDGLDE